MQTGCIKLSLLTCISSVQDNNEKPNHETEILYYRKKELNCLSATIIGRVTSTIVVLNLILKIKVGMCEHTYYYVCTCSTIHG